MRSRTYLLVVTVAGAAALGVYTRSALSQSAGQLIPQPASWVPFSAELRDVREDGAVTVGRFYRASDGSTRSETGPSLDNIRVVGINAISNATFYLWHADRGWTAQPMQLPPFGWNPTPTIFNSQMTGVTDKVEGFTVIRMVVGGNDRVAFVAPELNLFPLIVSYPCRGRTAQCGTVHFNIRVGEQPQEYFAPAEDALITRREEPGGIVRR
jgi:hypothetical protein